MTLALIFWVLLLIWAVFGSAAYWPGGGWSGPAWGGSLLLFLLFLLLGWAAFGPPIRG